MSKDQDKQDQEENIPEQKRQIEENASRKLTRLYIIALSAVALLTIIGQILIQQTIRRQKADSYVINMAGRQRFMSQEISKLALIIRKHPDSLALRDKIHKVTQRWASYHYGLKDGNDSLNLPGNNSKAIMDMFGDIEPHFKAMHKAAINVLAEPRQDSAKRYRAVEKVLSNEQAFLNGMDRIVYQYQDEARAKVRMLKNIEWVLMGVTLLILLLEGLFIFRPAANKIRKTIHDLLVAESRASDLSRRLRATNQSLEQSLREIRDVNYALDKAAILAKTDAYGIITYVNDKFCEISGFSREELIGSRFNKLNSRYHSRTFFNTMWETISQGKVWNREIQNRDKNGEAFWLDATIVPVCDENGKPYKYIGIYSDITEKFRQRIDRQRLKSNSIIQAQEEERKRISRELHDGIGQLLTALKFQVEELKVQEDPSEKEKKETVQELIKHTISETRKVSFNLMPSVFNDYGLISALKILARQTTDNTGIQVTFNEDPEYQELDKNVEITIYRIIQEALNNAVKYAEASSIAIEFVSSDDHLDVFVMDDGKGFNQSSQNKEGSGLMNIKERTKLINGEFMIETQPGEGTKIHIKVPYEKNLKTT